MRRIRFPKKCALSQSALAWISAAEHKGITWISTDKDEALFAYPETLRKNMYSMVDFADGRPRKKGGLSVRPGIKSGRRRNLNLRLRHL